LQHIVYHDVQDQSRSNLCRAAYLFKAKLWSVFKEGSNFAMIEPIVESSSPITLVGGGDAGADALQEALAVGPDCIAVDGGAALALAAGVTPAAVIGDFDSVTAADLAKIPADRRHHVTNQDNTDFEKALQRIAAPLVIGVGFLGYRLDHQLAALHGLMTFAAQPCLLVGDTEIVFLLPPVMEIPAAPGEVVSLFPLAPVRGTSSGLAWPIAGLDFAPGARIGTSNVAEGPVRLQMEAPAMLAILPRRLMRPVADWLAAPQNARWPVRAE
jgi:thiamine pyrophosphokinase